VVEMHTKNIFPLKIKLNNNYSVLQLELDVNFIDFYEGNNKLIITFDGYGPSHKTDDKHREPWGFKFLVEQGYSILGIKRSKNDWYRSSDLHEFFRSYHFHSFLNNFEKIVMYGGSMGGFAALTFAHAIPNCTVFALCPQTTLNRDLVPWEKRYNEALIYDWSSDFYDAYIGSKSARKVYIAYDPYFELDKKHIERLDQSNIVHLKIPFLEHDIAKNMLAMGILKQTLISIVENEEHVLNNFSNSSKLKRKLPKYYVGMAKKIHNNDCKIKLLQKAMTIKHNDIHLKADIANTFLELAKLDEALAVINDAIYYNPNLGGLYGIKSKILLKLNDLEKSLLMAKKYVTLEPDNINAKVIYSNILDELGQTKLALQIVKEAITINPHVNALHIMQKKFSSKLNNNV